MSAGKIHNREWRKIYAFLKVHPGVYTVKQADCRRFVEGVHWILRTGAQWRELPERYGNWNSIYKRFARWEENGIWTEMHAHFAQDPDMESAILDSSVIRAHMCAAGGSKKTVTRNSRLWDAAVAALAPRFTLSWMLWVTGCISFSLVVSAMMCHRRPHSWRASPSTISSPTKPLMPTGS
jgi:putative transposase